MHDDDGDENDDDGDHNGEDKDEDERDRNCDDDDDQGTVKGGSRLSVDKGERTPSLLHLDGGRAHQMMQQSVDAIHLDCNPLHPELCKFKSW